MQIATNVANRHDLHDSILHPSIEKQVYDIFKAKCRTLSYLLFKKDFRIEADGETYGITIDYKSVTIIMYPQYISGGKGIQFGDTHQKNHTVRLKYNTDISAKVNKFFDAVEKIKELKERAAKIVSPDKEQILAFLTSELAVPGLTVSYFPESLFNGLEILFDIYPTDEYPAEGVKLCFEKETNEINPFWNGSTERRTTAYSGRDKLEYALGHEPPTDIAGMKERIKMLEMLETKIKAFDPNKSPAFLQLLEAKKQANVLVEEYKTLVK